MECNDHFTKLAASMFGVPCAKVSPEMRRVAKQRALAGSYTARISNVRTVEEPACKNGEVRVVVSVDHIEPRPSVVQGDFSKLEEHVLAMYNTGKDDKQRADEYEAMLLKAFPGVQACRREYGRPLMASDFDPALRAMAGSQAAVRKAVRGRGISAGSLASRVTQLAELADKAEERGKELRKAWGELEDHRHALYKARCATSKLRDEGAFAGLPWDVCLNDEKSVAENLAKLGETLRGKSFADAGLAKRVVDKANERVAKAKCKARAAVDHAAFAAGMIGLAVGGLLGVIFAG